MRDALWTNDMDCELMEFYRTERNVGRIRDKYREKYGDYSPC